MRPRALLKRVTGLLLHLFRAAGEWIRVRVCLPPSARVNGLKRSKWATGSTAWISLTLSDTIEGCYKKRPVRGHGVTTVGFQLEHD